MNCVDERALAARHAVSGHYGFFSVMRKPYDGVGDEREGAEGEKLGRRTDLDPRGHRP